MATDPDRGVRIAAAHSLGQLLIYDDSTREAVSDGLQAAQEQEHYWVRAAAAEALP